MYEVEQKYRLTDPAAFAQALAEGNVEWTRETREEDTYFRHPTRDFRQTDEALRIRVQAMRSLSGTVSPLPHGEVPVTEECLQHQQRRRDGVGEVPEPVECQSESTSPFPASGSSNDSPSAVGSIAEAFQLPTGNEWTTRAFITYKGPKLRQSSKTREELELPLVTDAEQLPQWKALLQVLGFQPVTPVRKVRRKAWLEWQGTRVEISRDWVQNIGEFAELEIVVKGQDEIPEAEQKILALAQKLHLGDVEMKSYLELVLEDSHAALT